MPDRKLGKVDIHTVGQYETYDWRRQSPYDWRNVCPDFRMIPKFLSERNPNHRYMMSKRKVLIKKGTKKPDHPILWSTRGAL